MKSETKIPHDDFILDVPQHAMESLSRCFLPGIRAFFETEEGSEFEEWRRQQAETAATAAAKKTG